MFTPNNLYDYLRYYMVTNEKTAIVRNFKDGSLNPFDLWMYRDNNNGEFIKSDNLDRVLRFDPTVDMFDQEPIDIEIMKLQYKKVLDSLTFTDRKNWVRWSRHNKQKIAFPTRELLNLNNQQFFESITASLHIPIICHSEKNSDVLESKNILSVHYWFHAVLSQYWYQRYKILDNNRKYTNKKFGIYARSFDGYGLYRKQLLTELSQIKDDVYYLKPKDLDFDSQWNTNKNEISSSNSASIDWIDHEKFDIQIVAETLFNTNKIHLTEKIFKPIVMYQPFIVAGPPNSLKYLRTYGFKTFNELWDESYDLEHNHDKRLQMISDLVNEINNLNDIEYKSLLNKAMKIVKHNRELFYSSKFSKDVMNELLSNLELKLDLQQELFYKRPGGTLFLTARNLKESLGYIPKNYKRILDINLNNCVQKYPAIAQSILKEFKDLT